MKRNRFSIYDPIRDNRTEKCPECTGEGSPLKLFDRIEGDAPPILLFSLGRTLNGHYDQISVSYMNIASPFIIDLTESIENELASGFYRLAGIMLHRGGVTQVSVHGSGFGGKSGTATTTTGHCKSDESSVLSRCP